jgi:WD40 repeat protein
VPTPRLDDLVTDPEYLLAAEPDRLLAELDAVVEPDAVRAGAAYRLAVPYIRDEPAEAASHLQLAARRLGADQLADRIAYRGGLTWSTRWLLPAEEDRHLTPPVTVSTPTAAACLTRPDGQRVAIVAHQNGRIGAWDLDEGAPPLSTMHDAHDAVSVACVRPSGSPALAVTAGLDGRVCFFDADTGILRHTTVVPPATPLPGSGSYHPPGVRPARDLPEALRAVAAGLLPDGRAVAVTFGDRGWLRWWDPATGTELGATRLLQSGRAVGCGLSRGRPVAVASTSQELAEYDLTTRTATGRSTVIHSGLVEAIGIAATRGGDSIVVATDGYGRLHRWWLSTLEPLSDPLHGHHRDARTVSCGRFSDGRPIAVTGGFDGTVRVWDLLDGTQLHRIPLEQPVHAVALADDLSVLVGTSGGIGVLRLADR